MTVTPTLPQLFEYLDFRRYLDDYFIARRLLDHQFSLRSFTLAAGLPLSNSSLFSKVIAGSRNLTSDVQYKIAKALKLNGSETQYFSVLVRFCQSKSPEAKDQLFRELAKYRKSKARIITQEGYDYYANWRNAIIRAYFGIHQNEKNPVVIGKALFPEVAAPEVEASIRLLMQLGLISKTANGYTLRDANIATERENKEYVGKLRIHEMLKLAQDVFPHIPAEQRDYSAMTVFISEQGFHSIQEKIRVFREEIKSLVSNDQGEDRIYSLALQFFPNSQFPDPSKSPSPKASSSQASASRDAAKTKDASSPLRKVTRRIQP
jgi:uncharacterized protein (TIGR02147 family)